MTAPDQVSTMALSPDGRRVAGIAFNGLGAALFVMQIESGKVDTVVEPVHLDRSYTRSPARVMWIADDLLGVDFNDGEAEAIDLSGKKVAFLGEQILRRASLDPAKPPELLVYRSVSDASIDRVDPRTGRRERYRVSLPGKMIHSAFDASGRLRAVTMLDSSIFRDNAKISNWYRDNDADEWHLLATFGIADDPWWPMFVPEQPHALAVVSRHDRDTYAVFRYDTQTRAFGEVMAGHPREDISLVSEDAGDAFKSVITEGLKPLRYWFDAHLAGLQKAIDQGLPGKVNVLSPQQGGTILVFSYSDRDPGRWYALDTASLKLRELEQARPKVDPAAMRPVRTLTYAARDGLQLNGYLTQPKASDAALPPMVVLIHGGPSERDHWQWDREVQLLALHGYAVFQPQFRGSTGFGKRYESAGYRQWGRAMQDDITDGVSYLIAQKLVDPKRICISGGSYGGYAALWGVVKTPDLYRCGISFAGVSNLADMLTNSLFNDSTAVTREWSRTHIGDPAVERQRLDEVSPLLHAAEVTVPMLIAHGQEDLRVPITQSRLMVRALESNQKEVEWLVFEREAHGLARVVDQRRYYRAMLEFLHRHIGGESPAPLPVAPPS